MSRFSDERYKIKSVILFLQRKYFLSLRAIMQHTAVTGKRVVSALFPATFQEVSHE
jgi:hypothetical protein